MAKGLLDRLIDSVFDDNWVGRYGEKLTERELKIVNLFGRKGKTLRNLYLPADKGETSEIDLVYITQKGIFVFESKNYSGWIFGDEQEQYWTAMLPNRQKNRFYNPIRQNKTHMKWLGQYLGPTVPLFSIIVFSERCELKKVTVTDPAVRVIQRDWTYAAVRKIWDSAPDVLTDEEVNRLYEELIILTSVDEAVKAAHIRSIQNRFQQEPQTAVTGEQKEKAKESDPAEKREDQPLFCPRCGKELVLRTAKKGSRAGEQFYGCSGYPNCRFTKTL